MTEGVHEADWMLELSIEVLPDKDEFNNKYQQ